MKKEMGKSVVFVITALAAVVIAAALMLYFGVIHINNLIDCLAEKYGTTPVIYVSSDTYNTIVKDEFTDCPLWYRSVYTSVPKDIDWTFWQYSNRHVLSGYKGKEKFIDMNTFNGSKEKLEKLVVKF